MSFNGSVEVLYNASWAFFRGFVKINVLCKMPLMQVKNHFKNIGVQADVKYIDPTYMIRACRANASDRILCAVLGQNAVHAGFAGFTGVTVGIANNHYVLLPIPEVIAYARNVDPNSRMWHRCLTSTGQPDFL